MFMMSRYMLVKKSTVFLLGLAAAGLVGCHYYKRHRREFMRDMDQFTDDVTTAARQGARKVKSVVDEANS